MKTFGSEHLFEFLFTEISLCSEEHYLVTIHFIILLM